MKKQLFWREMKRDIVDFIAKCLLYQKVKVEHRHPMGIFYPSEILTQKWQSINMDFIIGLPKTNYQRDSIFIMVDRLTKVAHFILENTTDDAMTVAKRFVKDIFHLHGFPKSIISNIDSKFTSTFQQTLHKEIGTQLIFSSSYHLESNRKIERVNQVLEDMLRMYYMDQRTKWEDYFHLVEFTYNNTFQFYLRMAPFETIQLKMQGTTLVGEFG